eukprot:scaffold49238_cov13-Tisochrysis_lutea.AAC.1
MSVRGDHEVCMLRSKRDHHWVHIRGMQHTNTRHTREHPHTATYPLRAACSPCLGAPLLCPAV